MKIYQGVGKSEKRVVEEIMEEISTTTTTWKTLPLTKENGMWDGLGIGL